MNQQHQLNLWRSRPLVSANMPTYSLYSRHLQITDAEQEQHTHNHLAQLEILFLCLLLDIFLGILNKMELQAILKFNIYLS